MKKNNSLANEAQKIVITDDAELERMIEERKGVDVEISALKAKQKEIDEAVARYNSLKFIQAHGLTKDMVRDIRDETGYIHDNEKLCHWIIDNVNEEWFTLHGLIRQRKGFNLRNMYQSRNGQYPGRYKDLV